MIEPRWFVPDLDDPNDMTAQEHAFAAALSGSTARLVCPGVGDFLIPAEYGDHGDDTLVAGLSFTDLAAEPRLGLVEFGVHYRSGRINGGRLHNQLYSLSDQTPSLSLTATGTVDALAERTAEWFEAVLARPVVLYVWLHDGYAYAARYAFADTSETLAQSYSADRAPSGQYASVIAAGHVQGRGWLQTAGLPTPDLYLHIRGDMESATIPAGVHAETRRGPLPGRWYE
jgi:hypothetical protein